jgi:hypothetical protein
MSPKDYNNLTLTQIDSMRRTALRELDKRKNFYPRFVQAGKMSQSKADFELEAMKEIVDYFNWLQIHTAPEQQTLF